MVTNDEARQINGKDDKNKYALKTLQHDEVKMQEMDAHGPSSFTFQLQNPLQGFSGGSDIKESACNAGDHDQSLSQEDPLEKEMAI